MSSLVRTSSHVDLCQGPLIRQMAMFSLPLILSGLLQICFNAADMIVVGRFASSESLAAVGSTGPLCNLIVTVFMGLSVGANVVVAHFTGAKDARAASRATHTTISVGVWCGLALVGLALVLVEPLLSLMGVPEDVLSLAVVYTLITSIGFPFMLLYNFGAAILRAVGDTKRPTMYLFWSGLLNVVLNLVLVIGFSMDVVGVAVATVMSQVLSAVMVLRALAQEPTADAQTEDTAGIGLRWKLLRVDWTLFKNVLRIGLPAGFQGIFYSGSNIIILSAIASLGGMALAGNAAAGNLEGFLYVIGSSFQQAAVSFVGQNYGGKRLDRVHRSIRVATVGTVVFVTLVSVGMLFEGNALLRLYASDEAALAFGLERMRMMFPLYALCPMMEVLGGSLRGLGHSLQPTVTTFLGACVMRVLWVKFVFPLNPSMSMVMISLPISWGLICLVNGVFLRRALRRIGEERREDRASTC